MRKSQYYEAGVLALYVPPIMQPIAVALTLIVLSQLPVASTPPCGDSIHLTTRMGASCWAT